MILAPLAAAALVVTVATGPVTEPTALPPMSAQQKSAAMQALVRSATECIARTVIADPRFGKTRPRRPDRGFHAHLRRAGAGDDRCP